MVQSGFGPMRCSVKTPQYAPSLNQPAAMQDRLVNPLSHIPLTAVSDLSIPTSLKRVRWGGGLKQTSKQTTNMRTINPSMPFALVLCFLAFILRWCFGNQHNFPNILLFLHLFHGIHHLLKGPHRVHLWFDFSLIVEGNELGHHVT